MDEMDLLPIGSVVKLGEKEQALPLMIVGYYPFHEEKEEIYDYMGILYPQGVLTDESFFMFRRDDIQEVIYQGYMDQDAEELCEGLPAIIQEMGRKAAEQEDDQD